ncbi:DUF1360 domain-containing protein [Streptomyces longisporoflavus]|uniref:DUF1360 domain-containing protein n=1 Tax=Streptomyces longisporoflavus TaxID=28044 RepID=A0ABW7QQH5_9ACTN
MTDAEKSFGQEYDERGNVPLGGYAVLMAAFTAMAGGTVALARKRGVGLPEQVPPWDVALLGVATFKTARLLTKDKITSFLRAPFTRRAEDTTAAETMDVPRGSGLRLAAGDLASCPFCMSAWTAAGLMGAYVFSPRAARVVGAGFAAMTLADWLQYAWAYTQQEAED